MAINISMFQDIPKRKHVRQIFAYPDAAMDFIRTYFYEPYQFLGDTKFFEIIIRDLLLNES